MVKIKDQFGILLWYNGVIGTMAGPPQALSHWGQAFVKKGQLQDRLKQLNLEQDSGHNTR